VPELVAAGGDPHRRTGSSTGSPTAAGDSGLGGGVLGGDGFVGVGVQHRQGRQRADAEADRVGALISKPPMMFASALRDHEQPHPGLAWLAEKAGQQGAGSFLHAAGRGAEQADQAGEFFDYGEDQWAVDGDRLIRCGTVVAINYRIPISARAA
jgi:hypothetical protein